MPKNHFRKEFDIREEGIGKNGSDFGFIINKNYGKSPLLPTLKEFFEEIRIEASDKDYEGSPLSPKKYKLFRMLKIVYLKFFCRKKHKTERKSLDFIKKISKYLELNKNIRNAAAQYFKKIFRNEKKVINSVPLIGFCIFYATRKERDKSPITIAKITNALQDFGYKVNYRHILRDGIRYK